MDHNRGTLKAPGDSQKITLTFKPKACEIFSTFLVLDNLANIEDVKTIKVYMEVRVATPLDVLWCCVLCCVIRLWVTSRCAMSHAVSGLTTLQGVTAQTSSFSVYVDPLAATHGPMDETGLSINMGPLYFGQTYSDRSFIISNLSASPLHFSVRASTLQ